MELYQLYDPQLRCWLKEWPTKFRHALWTANRSEADAFMLMDFCVLCDGWPEAGSSRYVVLSTDENPSS